MPGSRIETLDSSRAGVYARRAENLLKTAKAALATGNADGAATAGVQSVVSFADAFTVWHLRQRSKRQDHHEVIGLIARCRTPDSAAVAKLVQLALNRKNEVEYGSREVTRREASEIVTIADKLAVLVRSSIETAP